MYAKMYCIDFFFVYNSVPYYYYYIAATLHSVHTSWQGTLWWSVVVTTVMRMKIAKKKKKVTFDSRQSPAKPIDNVCFTQLLRP